jgi:hypothetical protein
MRRDASMSDLDRRIAALLVAGESERDVCLRLGCTMGPGPRGLNARRARMSAPLMRAEAPATLDALSFG